MSQLDKTRERIKIEELDNSDRKELFNKFVKGGGQVVSEKPKRTIKIDRQKQKELAARMDAHRKKMQSPAGSSPATQKSSISSPQPPAPVTSGLDLLIARFRLYFMGVSNLGGDYFKKKFLEQFKVEYNPALMELQMIYLDIFKQNPAVGHKIIEQMDKNRPLYYELAEMTGDIWEKTLSSQIIDNYTVMPDEKYRIYEHRDPVLAYLKKLYILSKYVDTIYFSFDKAIEYQARIEKGKSAVYAAKRKKIKNSLFVTFNKLYPRLYWLFCLMRGEIISLEETGRLDQLFNIKPFMKPGNRMANQPPSHLSSFIDATGKLNPEVNEEETASSEQEQPIEDEIKEEAHIPEDVRRGLDIMQEIDFAPLKKSYAKDDIMRTVSENDKILQTYLLFLEFDREYSFVLTTYKIKFNPLHDSRGRIDFRTKLTDIYNQMRPCFDALKEYFVALDIYEKARLDRPSSHDQYYKYSKRLAELEQDKKNKARNARTQISNYMGNIADALLTLIQDMNVRNEIIQNPQDMIEFDNSLESDRKLNNKKIFEAVVTTHSYASAFYYRLSPLGDLSGDTSTAEQPPAVQNAPVAETPAPTLVKTVKSQPVPPQEIIPEPIAQPQNVSEEKKPEPQPVKDEPEQPERKRPENDSILGELDDIDKLDDLL